MVSCRVRWSDYACWDWDAAEKYSMGLSTLFKCSDEERQLIQFKCGFHESFDDFVLYYKMRHAM